MRKVIVFNNVTVDGYFTDQDGDMSWAHDASDEEFNSFIADNAKGDAALLFGRKTYEMMASYWPTPMAMENDAELAKAMNRFRKFVFSRTLDKAGWNNTKVLKGDLVAEVRKLKKEAGPDLMIFGSGSIVSQLSDAGLIDEYQLVICPIVLGKGRTMFEGMKNPPTLKLKKSRAFKQGKVFLTYESRA